jgi:D-xylose transport system permease protein
VTEEQAVDLETTENKWSVGSMVRLLEIDTRLLGMAGLLAVIWIGFNILSDGTFLSPRNLWNLSVQTASVAVMATGMVLVIVSRNIDLSVGSIVGVVGMFIALLQAEWLPGVIGFDHPATWIIAVVAGLVLGAIVGAVNGVIIAYVGVPSFIVTLGGLLVWRGATWWLNSGQTVAPLDTTYRLLGGGSRGSIGATWSWVVGGIACLAILLGLVARRRARHRFGFKLRPLWAVWAIGLVGCIVVLGSVAVLNSYFLPEVVAMEVANERGLVWPPEGLEIARGIAYPVLIIIAVTVVMTFVANRRRFGRYVFAIGGNPEAAELGGIKTRRTLVKTFMVMGLLAGVAAVISTARLNAGVTSLGQLSELYVIAAAVIGGTSLTGGVGTITGAVLGALVMQSLQSGMVLLGIDAPLQDIVVGIVLVAAVAVDTIYRRRSV